MRKNTPNYSEKFYLTTPIYYVNEVPHIGHAYTTIAADVVARYRRIRGGRVFFLCGTDEHAQKNVESALKKSKKSPPNHKRADTRAIVRQYVDEMSAVWQRTWDELDISNDDFIRTTEKRHIQYVEKFWSMVKKGDIYKGKYEGLYCTGCEAYKAELELVDGKCPDHKRVPETLCEENYFFRLSAYRTKVLRYIKQHPEFIQPEARRNEVAAYLQNHAEDFSISRKNLEWGIPVPGDPSQTVYVWFDALLNYLSAVSPPSGGAPPPGGERGKGWWPADLHFVGKDIIKFHCAYWPAMLLSAGLPLPRTVFAHGFFTIDGQKMSKTLGNVVDPVAVAHEYGNDVLRYYLLREIPFGADGDFSLKHLRQRYNGELANGLGNLVARVLSMIERYCNGSVPKRSVALERKRPIAAWWSEYNLQYMAQLKLDMALALPFELSRALDEYIDREQPWKLAKSDKPRMNGVLYVLAENLRHIAWMLLPFMPETAQSIFDQLGAGNAELKKFFDETTQWGGLKPGTKIKRGESLFPRLQ